MKKVDLNRFVTDINGNPVSLAQLQRNYNPEVAPTAEQEVMSSTYGVIAYSHIDEMRGRRVTDEQKKKNYALMQKINAASIAKSIVELDEYEFDLVKGIFDNQKTTISAPFVLMVEELNPVE